MPADEKQQKVKSIISTGAEIAGAAVGGALGFLAAGPVGSAAAGSLGVLVAKTGSKLLGDLADRTLSEREKIRIGATAAIAFDKIEKNTSNGNAIRDDSFFEEVNGERSKAEELLEGTLRKARDEYQEKKLSFLGNFYANVTFSPGISVEEANYYLRQFESITYRQLCVICLVFMKPYHKDYQNLRNSNYRNNKQDMSASALTLLQEITELYNMGLVAVIENGGVSPLLGWHDIVPLNLSLTAMGERFKTVFLAGSNFDIKDSNNVAELLR